MVDETPPTDESFKKSALFVLLIYVFVAYQKLFCSNVTFVDNLCSYHASFSHGFSFKLSRPTFRLASDKATGDC